MMDVAFIIAEARRRSGRNERSSIEYALWGVLADNEMGVAGALAAHLHEHSAEAEEWIAGADARLVASAAKRRSDLVRAFYGGSNYATVPDAAAWAASVREILRMADPGSPVEAVAAELLVALGSIEDKARGLRVAGLELCEDCGEPHVVGAACPEVADALR